MVPKIIHNIWLQGYDNIPNEMKLIYTNIKKLNPEWDFIVWDETMILQLLEKYPKIMVLYKNSNNNYLDKKTLLARYAILDEHGGFYYDIDTNCQSSLNDFLLIKEENIVERGNNNTIHIACSKANILKYLYPFYQPLYESNFIGMKKHHPIWKAVWKKIEDKPDLVHRALNEILKNMEDSFPIETYYQGENNCFQKSKIPISYFNRFYKQVLLLVLIPIIIFTVEKIYQHNIFIMTSLASTAAIKEMTKTKNK